MTKVNTKKAAPLKLSAAEGESEEQVTARAALRPTITAAAAIEKFPIIEGLELAPLVESLAEQAKAVNSGNLIRVEAMLISQAHTLDAIFSHLARRSAMNLGEYLNAAERYMRLALKAQSQCRATLQTLGELKQPKPVAFVQQANIAHGPQQVNNGPPFQGDTRAQENKNQPNELLEEQPNEQLDTGAPGTAGGVNQAVETLGAINRTENC